MDIKAAYQAGEAFATAILLGSKEEADYDTQATEGVENFFSSTDCWKCRRAFCRGASLTAHLISRRDIVRQIPAEVLQQALADAKEEALWQRSKGMLREIGSLSGF